MRIVSDGSLNGVTRLPSRSVIKTDLRTLPGTLLLLLLTGLLITAFYALITNPVQILSVWKEPYTWKLVRFTFYQAFLSASLATIIGLFISLSLIRFNLPLWLPGLLNLFFVMPVIIVVLAVVNIYGRSGVLSQLIQFKLNIYGLSGILIAHLLMNIPFAVRLFLASLQQIPGAYLRLSSQLGLSEKQRFTKVIWPRIRSGFFSTWLLIFLLCFGSFTVVLALGGGPKSTILEVAVYQSLRIDYDRDSAAAYAILQFLLTIGLAWTSIKVGTESVDWKGKPMGLLWGQRKFRHLLWLILFFLFTIPPFIALIVNGFKGIFFDYTVLEALKNSLIISTMSASISILMALLMIRFIAYSSRYKTVGELSVYLIFLVPPMVLTTGLYLAFWDLLDFEFWIPVIVAFVNALMALPFVVKMIKAPLLDIIKKYDYLCDELSILKVNKWKQITWPLLKAALLNGFGLAFVLSIGDMGVIALIGSTEWPTLPWAVYQQLGRYRIEEAAFLSIILISVCFLVMTFFERVGSDLKNV